MSETVTLALPDSLASSARSVAAQTNRRLEDVLLEWLDRAATELPVESLPDDQVLALRDLHLSAESQQALSDLLAQQREGTLDQSGHSRLGLLMAAYRRDMVRKAQALKVAVDRGLQPPLSPPGTD